MANIMGFDNATLVGNVLTIAPGRYGGAFVSAKPSSVTGKLTVIATGAIFGSQIYLPETLSDVEFVNFTFENVTNTCWQWKNDKVGVGLTNISFLNNKATNCFSFALIGSWTDFNQQTSLSTNIEFAGNQIINSVYNNVFTLNKSFGLKFHDNIIDTAGGPGIDDASHEGLVFIRWSDGEFWNNRITKGGGNAFRILPAGNKQRGYVNIHDNYVGEMRKHSAVESNSDNLGIISGDIDVKFNTFGNLSRGIEPNAYESAGVAVYLEGNAKHTKVENNIVYNTSKGVVFYGDGSHPTTEIGNFYFPTVTEAGVVNGITQPTSPAYGKAGAGITDNTKDILLEVNLDDGKTFTLYEDDSYSLQ